MMTIGKVLIVDDSATVRLKISKAVAALGYEATTADSGAAAIAAINKGDYDVVLLDIVMPELDGFEVLRLLKSTPKTKDLPIIVISALGDKMTSVVKAISLGAEDFLPKDFEPALLDARVSTSIEKKRLRDGETQYIKQVEILTRAAKALAASHFNPSKLGLETIANRPDGLGVLAKVFSNMAQEVYQRERKLRQKIRTFRGALLLIACGSLWGAIVPIAKLASQILTAPIGLAFLVDCLGAILCLGYAASLNKLPKLSDLTGKDWTFIVALAVLSSLVNKVLLFWLASRIPAFIVAIVLVLEGFMVFLFAAAMRIEAPSLKRFSGLCLGLVGVSVVLYTQESTATLETWISIGVALLIPLSYAAENLYISEKRPKNHDAIALFGIALVCSALMLAPAAWYSGEFIPIEFLSGELGFLVVLIAVFSCLANVLFFRLIATAGSVFAGQAAYVITVTGVGWSIILLSESVPILSWAALLLIGLGLILVEPKREAEEEPLFLDAA